MIITGSDKGTTAVMFHIKNIHNTKVLNAGW